MRWIATALGVALALSLAALAYVILDAGHLQSDMSSTVRYQEAEIGALRDLALRLQAGENAKAAVVAAGKEEAFEKEGWLVAGPLTARFHEGRLAAICGSVSVDSDPCTRVSR